MVDMYNETLEETSYVFESDADFLMSLHNDQYELNHVLVELNSYVNEAYINAAGDEVAMESELAIVTEGIIHDIWEKICKFVRKIIDWFKGLFRKKKDNLTDEEKEIRKKYPDELLRREFDYDLEDTDYICDKLQHCIDACKAMAPVLDKLGAKPNEFEGQLPAIKKWFVVENYNDIDSGTVYTVKTDKNQYEITDTSTKSQKISFPIYDKLVAKQENLDKQAETSCYKIDSVARKYIRDNKKQEVKVKLVKNDNK